MKRVAATAVVILVLAGVGLAVRSRVTPRKSPVRPAVTVPETLPAQVPELAEDSPKGVEPVPQTIAVVARVVVPVEDEFFRGLVEAAIERTTQDVVYDAAYVQLAYPGGDVPEDRGVCTDVIVRCYRKVGVDLQKEVHEDMAANFGLYPKNWGLRGPDRNIDHRRVPNLMKFFERNNGQLTITNSAADYQPGDVVAWTLDNGLPHMGIVTNERSPDGERFMVVHNIGQGPQKEDGLFAWKIIGHYRYKPE